MTAPTLAYLNGTRHRIEDARVSILDRGFLFGEGAYEVIAVLGGTLLDAPAHLERLRRSCREASLPPPPPDDDLLHQARDLLEREPLTEGLIYIQQTRGAESMRRFSPPPPGSTLPTTLVFAQAASLRDDTRAARGIEVISTPDLRWARPDIKSTSLLAQVLAKEAAQRAGVEEAWMLRGETITEGASSAAFLIDADGALQAPPCDGGILDSITRRAVLRLAGEEGIPLRLESFSRTDVPRAREAFLASATALILPVVRFDGHPIGQGTPGPLTLRLRHRYLSTLPTE